MTAPSVSVCIPVYNGADTLEATLRSALDQTYDDLEVVVTDNCSTDASVEIAHSLADPRVRVHQNEQNLGMRANWDQALQEARGSFVKLLCADDVLYPDCLAGQVKLLESHPDVVMVAGRRDVVNDVGDTLVPSWGLARLEGVVPGAVAIRASVRWGSNIFGEPLCVLMRTPVARDVGPFSDALPYVIDLDFWLRLLQRGNLFAQREVVGAFRVWSRSTSLELASTQTAQKRALFRLLHEHRPELVSRPDLLLGSARAAILTAGRLAIYRFPVLAQWANRKVGRTGRWRAP